MPNEPEVKRSPMLEMYDAIKAKLPKGMVLLFRVGDFYEAFDDDAATIAATLTLALCKRGTTRMAGIPYHSIERYARLLVKAGHKVAIADYLDKNGKVAPNPKVEKIEE